MSSFIIYYLKELNEKYFLYNINITATTTLLIPVACCCASPGSSCCIDLSTLSSTSYPGVIERHSMPSGHSGFSFSERMSRMSSAGIAEELVSVISKVPEFPKVVILPKSKASSLISTRGMIVLTENSSLRILPPLTMI